MLYIRSSEFIYLNWKFVPFDQHLLISSGPEALATTILLCFYKRNLIFLPHT